MKAKSLPASSRRGTRPAANATITVDAKNARELAAGAAPIAEVQSGKIDLSDIPETDFAKPNAVRGKYYSRFLAASGLVQLDPDVRPAFADDNAVNRALRHVLELAKEVRP